MLTWLRSCHTALIPSDKLQDSMQFCAQYFIYLKPLCPPPHSESQYQWEGALGKQLCLLSCFCFQRTVILTNPPETRIVLTHLIRQAESEGAHPLLLRDVDAWIRAWKREGCPCQAALAYLVTENLCVEICIFCFLQAPLLLLHQVLVLFGCVTEQVAIGTVGLPSGEGELQEMGILQTLPL